MNERHAVLLQILCLANCLSRELGTLNTDISDEGISPVNAQILSYLATHEDTHIFQRDIEIVFSIRRSTVSKVVQLMEAKGLIERESVASDARLKRLKLTDKARRIHEIASAEYSAFEKRVTQALSSEEIQTLSTLLEKISSSLTIEKIEEKP